MSGELGKASLDLEANLGPFERNLEKGHVAADRLDHALESLARVADACERALNDVKMDAGQAARSRVSAEQILAGVHGISDESRTAAREIDKVKLGSEQATETEVAGDVIDHKLDEIRDSAERTQRALDGVRLRLAVAGGGGARRAGYGLGPFGAGYGRLGVVGTLVGLGAAVAPAAGPAALGLLAAIPALASAGVGALGTLMLAFDGVTKAIGGDKKAFNDLGPSAKQFVLTVRSLDGAFDKLRQTAAASLFPGLTKGLKAALSPGTVNALFSAVTAIGKAIGSVGAEFGRYFGSGEFQKIFGPLMASAARNIRVAGDSFLHLFDALGVFMRAAIPFTNWLSSAINKGAKLADSWIHAKDASGALASAMDKAKTSLTLIAHLAGALIKVVVDLGKALYPISGRVLKDLIGGLNGLDKTVKVLAPALRGALGGALSAIEAAVKAVWPAVVTLADVLLKLVGVAGRALVPVIHALQPLFNALQTVFKEIEPPLAKIIHDLGVQLAPIVKALAKPTADFVRAMGPVFVAALKILDPLLKVAGTGVLYLAKAFGYLEELSARALQWVESHWKSFGHFFANLGHEIVHAFEYAWYLIEKGAIIAALKVVEPFSHLPSFLGGWARKAKDSMQAELDRLQPPNMAWGGYAEQAGTYDGAAWKRGFLSGIAGLAQQAFASVGAAVRAYAHRHHHHHAPTYPTLPPVPSPTNPFGPEPPFTKNLGSHHHHHQLTAAQKRQNALQYALDKAVLAVQKAKVGSKTWDEAIKREEKALEAEIHYWNKRAHDANLSKKLRDEALRKEIQYVKELHALQKELQKQLTAVAAAKAANEAQFLQAFVAIQNTFAPNAVPYQGAGPQPSGKTDTHLHEIKQEARQTNRHLKAMRDRNRFRHSHHAHDAAMAVG